MLDHRQGEPPFYVGYGNTTTRKSIFDRRVEQIVGPDFANGLYRRSEVRTIVTEYRRPGADLRYAYRCIRVCSEMIVETPVSNRLS